MSGASAGRAAPAGSEFIEGLLAETPQLRDATRQRALTERFLAPAEADLTALFRELRAGVDPVLRAAEAASGGKPYPLGRCLPITEAVQAQLDGLQPTGLSVEAAAGWAALRRFREAGGTVRRAWGDLRGRYFQNALIVGALYVDVANDTVVVEKPPVEILPFAESGLRPIADYGHFARIAAAYWRHDVLPNHLIPGLAPYFPLVQITPGGRVSLGVANRYMLGLTLAGGFAPSARALAAPPMPPSVFAGLSRALRRGSVAVAASAPHGRRAALEACGRARADDLDAYGRAMAAARAANLALAQVVAIPTRAAGP